MSAAAPWKPGTALATTRLRDSGCYESAVRVAASLVSSRGLLPGLASVWGKVFDSISPESVNKSRRFTVRDGGHQPCPHAQQFGISQGCPLSPVLGLQELSSEIKNPDMVNELLYADDTLVIALDNAKAQGYMTCMALARVCGEAGARCRPERPSVRHERRCPCARRQAPRGRVQRLPLAGWATRR